MRNAPRRAAAAAAAALAAVLSGGCSDAGAEAARQVVELKARVEIQAAEIETLRDRLQEMEVRSRSLEEQVASARAFRAPGTGDGPAPAAGAGAAAEEEPASQPDDLAALLETEQGKDRLREFLSEEEAARRERSEQERRQQMETMIRDRVTGILTEQLNLDRVQQDSMLTIAMDAMDRMSEIWAAARESRGDPAFFTTAREKTREIRQEALDQVQQVLTVDQFEKFKEVSGDGGMFFMGGGPGRGGRGGGGGFRGR